MSFTKVGFTVIDVKVTQKDSVFVMLANVGICACWLLIRITKLKIIDEMEKDNKTSNTEKPMAYDALLWQVNFEKFVIGFLENEKTGQLWWMSEFYEACCDELELNFDDIQKNQIKIRRLLRKMVKDEKIDVRRTGTGWGGVGKPILAQQA